MSRHAIEEIDEAWTTTKETVRPFDLGKYLKLMLIVFFAGTVSSMPTLPTGSFDLAGIGEVHSASIPSLVVLIALAALLLGGLYLVLSGVFQFVLYQVVKDQNVEVRNYFRIHFGKGLRYAGFLFVFGLLILSIFAGLIWSFMVNPLLGVFFLLGGLLLALPLTVFFTLTQNFVVPEMIRSDTGVIQGWKNVYEVISLQKREVLVYILVRWILQIGAGLINGLWALTSLIVLLVPFSIVGATFAFIWAPLVAIPVFLGLLAWMLAMLALQALVQTYLYAYALGVYEKLDK